MRLAGGAGDDNMTRAFSIDLRTLALFRICLGLIILADLINRAQFLTVFYTDAGVLPRAEAIAFNHWARISFHLGVGSTSLMALLFVVEGLFAILLILGYRTRWVMVISWILLLSMQNRNMVIQQGGDQLLGALAFWAMFLPLGARYSVDAALRPDNEPAGDNRYVSAATVAILLQAIYVYFVGALLKDNDIWMPDGDAVYYALHLDSIATPLGYWFRDFGAPVLPLLTVFVWTIEFLAPFLMFSPVWHVQLRLVTQFLLISMHLGFVAFLRIGLFPAVSISSLLLFTPSAVWDWLGARVFP
ncbi:MAG: HTTM domain-containing protein, partial [Alphaproteobacteria bacterium]